MIGTNTNSQFTGGLPFVMPQFQFKAPSGINWTDEQEAIFERVTTTPDNIIIDATAGSGKTLTIEEIVDRIFRISPRTRIACFAFNRHIFQKLDKAFKLAGGRKKAFAYTMNSFGAGLLYRSLKLQPVEEYKLPRVTKQVCIEHEIDYENWHSIRQVVEACRLTLTSAADVESLTQMANDYNLNFDPVWQGTIQEILKRMYEEAIEGIIDFTDQLYMPVVMPGVQVDKFDVILVDEYQDLKAVDMALLTMALKPNGKIVFVGDQCQPAGTKVTFAEQSGNRWQAMKFSQKNIENLKVGDSVVSVSIEQGYYHQSAKVTGISKRPYNGELVVVTMPDGTQSRYAPNHHCIASFRNLKGKHALYLGLKGQQFRIGISCISTKAMKGESPHGARGGNANNGPFKRFRDENCDQGWILAVYDTREEAMIMEQAVSGKFGIPQLMFDPRRLTKFDGEMLEKAWAFIGSNYLRGVECLKHFKRDIRYPFYDKDRGRLDNKPGEMLKSKAKNTLTPLLRTIIVHAANLIDGCVMLKSEENQKDKHFRSQDWQPVKISYEKYKGFVYSLTVEPHHAYIADRIATHNCQSIYSWAYSDYRVREKLVETFNLQEMPMTISFRCPVSHVELAQQVYPRIKAAPNAKLGTLLKHRNEAEADEADDSAVILCRRNKPLLQLAIRMMKTGRSAIIRGGGIGVGLAAQVDVIERLCKGEFENYGKGIQRLVDHEIQQAKARHATEGMYNEIHDRADCLGALFIGAQAHTFSEVKAYIEKLFRQDRKQAMTLSTVHRYKGGEADKVYILEHGKLGSTTEKMTKAEKIEAKNILFVALTRSKDQMILTDPLKGE